MLVILSAVGFAMKGVLAKLAYREGANGDTLLALRMVAALPFYLYALWHFRNVSAVSGGKLQKKDLLRTLLLGLLGFDLSAVLDFDGLERISASLERLVLFLYPTFVLFISWFVTGRRIGLRESGACLLAYGGVFLVSEGSGSTARSSITGILLVLGSALFYAVYLVGAEEVLKKVHPLWMTSVVMVTATTGILLQGALAGTIHLVKVNARVLAISGIMGLVSTAIPTFLMSLGVAAIGASRAAILSLVGPVATMILAWGVLGERLEGGGWAGAGLVVGGVMLLSGKEKKSVGAVSGADQGQ